MSALDRVREKFKVPVSGTRKSSKSPSAGSAASSHGHSETHAPPSAGFAGSPHRDSEKLWTIAADAPLLPDFREALLSGHLHICSNCAHFVAGGPEDIGRCRHFRVEAWPAAPFACSGFTASAAPMLSEYLPGTDVDRDRAQRVADAREVLAGDPGLRHAIVAGPLE